MIIIIVIFTLDATVVDMSILSCVTFPGFDVVRSWFADLVF